MNSLQTQRPGAIALIMIVLISAIALTTMVAASLTAGRSLSTVSSTTTSEQVFDAAEAGIQDALFRVGSNTLPSTYTTTINGVSVTITSTGSGFQRTITAAATDPVSSIVRTLRVTANTSTFAGGFSGAAYAAATLQADNSSTINGDVHIGGPATSGTINSGNSAQFNGNVWVAGATGHANNVSVTGAGHNLYSHFVNQAGGDKTVVSGDAYYQSISSGSLKTNGGSETCSAVVGTHCHPGSTDPTAQDFPITQSDIQALVGQITNTGNVATCIGGNFTVTTANPLPSVPTKIPCNLVFNGGNNTNFTLAANLWVTGNVSFSGNNQTIWLPTTASGNSSFIVSGDPTTPTATGTINIPNNITLMGSDHSNPVNPNDFIFLISMSTNNTISPLSAAISGSNNSRAAVFYAPKGLIEVANGGTLNNTTALQVHLNNTATLNYTANLSQFFISPSKVNPPTAVPNSWSEQ